MHAAHKLRFTKVILWVLYVIAAFGINSIHFWAQYKIFRPGGHSELLMAAFLLGAPFAIVLIVMVSSITMAFNKSKRRQALSVSIAAFVWVFAAILFMFMGFQYRSSSFSNIARNGNTIVKAIESYELDHGQPPNELQDLVPEYLFEIPHTGTCNPEFTYLCVDYQENEWALYLTVPALFSDWGVILYLPEQNYDKMKDATVFGERSSWAIADQLPAIFTNGP